MRSVVAHDLRMSAQRGVKGGDVGEADEGARTRIHGGGVEPVEDAHDSIAAAETPDAVDGVVLEGSVEVVEALLVGAGEVARARGDVVADDGFPSERPRLLDGGAVGGVLADGPCRGDECDARAWREQWRSAHRGERREGSRAGQRPGHLSAVTTLMPIILALPWVVIPVATIIRARNSRSLREESTDVPVDAPTVSVVIPARNEEHNI